MICEKCGNTINDDDRFCSKCGAPVTACAAEENLNENAQTAFEDSEPVKVTGEVIPAAPATQASQTVADSQQAQEKEDIYAGQKGKSIAGFVCSICGCVFPLFLLAASIVGLCLSCSAIKRGSKSGLAKAGKILGIIGICLAGLSIIIALIVGLTAINYILPFLGGLFFYM